MLGRQWGFRSLVRSTHLRVLSQRQPSYGFQNRLFSSAPVPSPYRVIIYTTLNTKKAAITQADVLRLFGVFDPYHIEVSTQKSEEGKGEEATIKFKVPRLRSVKEIKDSFSGNETLGSRMKIEAEKEVWPVLMIRLPGDMDAESLRKSLDGEGVKSGEKTDKDGMATLLAGSEISMYNSYAVIECESNYTALTLTQFTYRKEGGTVEKAEGEAPNEEEESDTVFTYPSWKTYPIRINNLAPETTEKDILKAFEQYLPYDVELLPIIEGAESRSAYVRLPMPEPARECVGLMDGTTLGGRPIKVRSAFDRTFQVLFKDIPASCDKKQAIEALSAIKGVADVDLVSSGASDKPSTYGMVARFLNGRRAQDFINQHSQQGFVLDGVRVPVSQSWTPFSLSVVNLPSWASDNDFIKSLVNPLKPYESKVEEGDSPSLFMFFATKEEAEQAASSLYSSGLEDIRIRKEWAVYRVHVKGLAMDTTEEDLMGVINDKCDIEILKSRKGKLKGEALIRFPSYDKALAGISKLYGEDSMVNDAINSGHWKAKDGKMQEEVYEAILNAKEKIQKDKEMKEQELRSEAEGKEDEDGLSLDLLGKTGPDSDPAYDFDPDGPWVHMVIDTDTTQKIVEGGQILSYRCLVVVGNLNGSGGWGMGKGSTPAEAKDRAFRAARKNLIHLDLYRNRCIAQSLYGKHNNCRIYIQAGNPQHPSAEGRMVNKILQVFGVECGEARSVGRRNPYSVVRAIFDAMSKHEGVEEISRKRGRRLISLSKARALGL